MGDKHPGSIAVRFAGPSKQQKILECLLKQRIVAGEQKIAKAMESVGKLTQWDDGVSITTQGASDNQIYFLLSGEIQIEVNNRVVSIRQRDIHFGEMALLDPTARRSATVKAVGETTVLQISEANFSAIANKYPQIWRRISAEIAERLRERSKFLHAPNAEPVVFIGSSSEAGLTAECIDKGLKRRGIKTNSWLNSVFQASNTAIEDLTRAAADCDFAVLILTPDDLTKSRKTSLNSPRDNVVFELGLFMGAIGRHRTLVVVEDSGKIRIPSDLLGLTTLRFKKPTASGTLGNSLRVPIDGISKRVKALGSK